MTSWRKFSFFFLNGSSLSTATRPSLSFRLYLEKQIHTTVIAASPVSFAASPRPSPTNPPPTRRSMLSTIHFSCPQGSCSKHEGRWGRGKMDGKRPTARPSKNAHALFWGLFLCLPYSGWGRIPSPVPPSLDHDEPGEESVEEKDGVQRQHLALRADHLPDEDHRGCGCIV